ncbi:MAG TPA: GNAT family N-acetyltransferase [Roseiflexaceae bacterium]|nr:GNAT family N-acetyltransferase [Roseiflexaceae bacterium]
MSTIIIANTRAEHIDQLEELQRICYPTLSPEHLMRRPHFESQLQIFPEGQHVALAGERVVGQSSTMRVNLDLDHPDHSFDAIIAGGYFTTHDPDGAWLYGADMSAHPDFRRRGIASQLYDARKALVRQLGLKGMVAGGMIPGYRFHRAAMPVEEYVARVARGELTDPTLTAQLRNGFTVRGVLHGYLHDALLGDDAALIVWERADA